MSAQVTREQRAALALVYAKYKAHGLHAFAVDPDGADKRDFPALQRAEACGWLWFSERKRCAVTRDAVRELAPYGVEEAG